MKGTSQYYPSYSGSSRRRAADGSLGERGLARASGAAGKGPTKGGGGPPLAEGTRGSTPCTFQVLAGCQALGLWEGWTVMGDEAGAGGGSLLPVALAHEAAT